MDYSNRYRNIRFERREGVLQVTLHSDGGPLKWGADVGSVHSQLRQAFRDIGDDTANKAVILTGSGDSFCAERNLAEYSEQYSPEYWYRLTRESRETLMNLLDIDVPVISAVNGPALVHSEIAVLADIVLAADTATFRDTHMNIGVVPGDGCHFVWNMLLGDSRGHYFLLTEEVMTAQTARLFGVVHEILPAAGLLPRAWEIATRLASKPMQSLRYARMLFTQRLKERLLRELNYGMAVEGLSVSAMAGGPKLGKS